MSGLALSNGALLAAVRRWSAMAPRLLVLGGGGYNPWSVARCWAGMWATLNVISAVLPPAAEAGPARPDLEPPPVGGAARALVHELGRSAQRGAGARGGEARGACVLEA